MVSNSVRAMCPLNVSLNLELCCPLPPLWTKPWRRRLYLVPVAQWEHSTVGSAFPALVLNGHCMAGP